MERNRTMKPTLYTPTILTTNRRLQTRQQIAAMIRENKEKIYREQIKCIEYMIANNIKEQVVYIVVKAPENKGEFAIESNAINKQLHDMLKYFADIEDYETCQRLKNLIDIKFKQQK